VFNFDQPFPFGQLTLYPSPRGSLAAIGDENARSRSRLPLREWSIAMPQQRRRIKHEKTFQERLVEETRRFKEAAEKLPPSSHAQELLSRE
jgi:hypothetical protein